MTTSMLLVWIPAGLILYAYLGYPLWVRLLAWLRPRPWQRAGILPTVTVVMAVREEAERLRLKLANLVALDYPADRLAMVVVCDGPHPESVRVLKACPDRRLRWLQAEAPHGKAAALNLALEHATSELVVFTDVRQRLEPAALRCIVANFADPSVGCAAGELRLSTEATEAAVAGVGAYWKYERWLRRWESESGSSVGASGAFYAVRRHLFQPLPRGLILDDVLLPLRIVRQGQRCVYDGRALAWDTPSASDGGEFRRKVRTLAGNLQLVRLEPWVMAAAHRLRFRFVSHKLLRLAVPFLLLLLFAGCWVLAQQPLLLYFAVLQTAFYAAGCIGVSGLGRRASRLLGVPAGFLLLNAAALVAVILFVVRGDRLSALWAPSLGFAEATAETRSLTTQEGAKAQGTF